MIRKRLVDICEALSMLDEKEIERAVQILKDAKARGNSVWIMGNGGSASTASHFANDLLKMCGVKAIDISGMTPVVTAFGNDLGWERMYANVVKRLAEPMDVIVAISCSGNSRNVLEAVAAHPNDVIVLTGADGGALARTRTAVCIKAMSDEITVQEDVHSIVCHEIAWRFRNG